MTITSNELTQQEKDLKEKVIGELYDLVLSPNITNFEREKIIKAKNLIESSISLFIVLRRLQITFSLKSVGNDLSPEFLNFYISIPQYINETLVNVPNPLLGIAEPL